MLTTAGSPFFHPPFNLSPVTFSCSFLCLSFYSFMRYSHAFHSDIYNSTKSTDSLTLLAELLELIADIRSDPVISTWLYNTCQVAAPWPEIFLFADTVMWFVCVISSGQRAGRQVGYLAYGWVTYSLLFALALAPVSYKVYCSSASPFSQLACVLLGITQTTVHSK